MKRIAFSGLVLASAALILAGCSVASEYEDEVAASTPKLIVQYGFETVSASNTVDNLASDSFDLGVTSNVTQVTGAVGSNALNFPVDSTGVDCGTITTSGALLSSSSTGMTISAYVKGTLDWSNLMYFTASSGAVYALDLANGYSSTISGVVYPGIATYQAAGVATGMTYYQTIIKSGVGTGGSVGTDGYAHEVVVIDFTNGTITYYANGAAWINYINMSAITADILSACVSGEVRVGRVYGDNAVTLDDFRIYDQAMTAAQVAALYTECEAAR